MTLSMHLRGILTLIGGFFLALGTGTVFLWGSVNVYITSYFRQKDDSELSLSVGGAIFPIVMVSLALGIPIGMKQIGWFGSARITCMLNGFFAALTVFLSSYVNEFWQFVLVYGVLNGIVQGMNYFVPIYMGYLYFPKNRGMVSGIVTGGFAMCSLVFGLIFFTIVNPDGISQIKNVDGYSYFEGPSISVAQNVPSTLRKMSFMYLGTTFLSSLLIMSHPNQVGAQERRLKKELQSMKEQRMRIEEQIDPHSGFNREEKELVFKHTIKVCKLEEEYIQKKIKVQKDEDQQMQSQIFFPQNNSKVEEIKLEKVKMDNLEFEDLKRVRFTIELIENNPEKAFMKQTEKILEIMNAKAQDKIPHTNSMICEKQDNPLERIEEMLSETEKTLGKEDAEIERRKQNIAELNKQGAPSVKIALQRPELYMSILLGITSLGIGVLVNGNYKSIAKDYDYKEDSYQTLLGSLAGLANGFTRPLWVTLLDKFTFKQILTVVLIIQIILSLTLQFSRNSPILLAIWVFIIHMVFGAVLGMWPVLSAALNGIRVGAQLFGMYWFGFSISTFIQFIIVYFLKNSIGFDNIYYIYTVQSFISLLIITYYKFEIDWSKYYIQVDVNSSNLVTTEQIGVLQNK